MPFLFLPPFSELFTAYLLIKRSIKIFFSQQSHQPWKQQFLLLVNKSTMTFAFSEKLRCWLSLYIYIFIYQYIIRYIIYSSLFKLPESNHLYLIHLFNFSFLDVMLQTSIHSVPFPIISGILQFIMTTWTLNQSRNLQFYAMGISLNDGPILFWETAECLDSNSNILVLFHHFFKRPDFIYLFILLVILF